jgi:hypothetical protein
MIHIRKTRDTSKNLIKKKEIELMISYAHFRANKAILNFMDSLLTPVICIFLNKLLLFFFFEKQYLSSSVKV